MVERREVGDLILEGVPDIPESISTRSLQYQETRSCMLQGWMPKKGEKEGGILITTRFGNVSQVHHVSHPGGDRQQLTFFKEPINFASLCPEPTKHHGFLYLRDLGGSEKYQTYFFNLDRGDSLLLSDGASRNGGNLWRHQGDGFAYFTTRRNGKDFDLRISYLNPETHLVERDEALIEEGGGWWHARDWSFDDKKLLVKKYISAAESHLYVLDLETKKLTEIGRQSEEPQKIRFGPCCWHPDGKGIYFTSNEGGEFQTLKFLSLEDPKKIISLSQEIRWDVEDLSMNKDGTTLSFTCNEDGASSLYLLSTSSSPNKPQKFQGDLPLGVISTLDFHPTNPNLLGLVIDASSSPGDVFSLDLSLPPSEAFTRWTFSEVGGLPRDLFVTPKLIYYDTFDKDSQAIHQAPDGTRRIPAFVYSPKKKPENKKMPVLIKIHGGPESQVRPSFNHVNQFLVNEMGIVVIEPNVRGSSGYGTTYLQLDFGMKRLDSIKDIGKLLEWVEKQEDLDSSRVAVYGGSYGGYMVLNSMIHFGDKLRCGAENVGITNFVTFLTNTESYRRDLRRQVYGDERIPEMKEFLLSVSPLTNCHKIDKPLLIGQGFNDPRVPYTEAEQLCESIRKNGQPVRFIMGKNEGHGFSKKNNRDFWLNSLYLFLDQYLLDGHLAKL